MNAIAGPVRLEHDGRAQRPKLAAAIASGVPMGLIGVPDDMAGVAIYPASAAGTHVTGAVVPVGGGLSTITEKFGER